MMTAAQSPMNSICLGILSAPIHKMFQNIVISSFNTSILSIMVSRDAECLPPEVSIPLFIRSFALFNFSTVTSKLFNFKYSSPA